MKSCLEIIEGDLISKTSLTPAVINIPLLSDFFYLSLAGNKILSMKRGHLCLTNENACVVAANGFASTCIPFKTFTERFFHFY